MRPAKADEEFKWDFVRRAICGFHRLLRRWKRNKLIIVAKRAHMIFVNDFTSKAHKLPEEIKSGTNIAHNQLSLNG